MAEYVDKGLNGCCGGGDAGYGEVALPYPPAPSESPASWPSNPRAEGAAGGGGGELVNRCLVSISDTILFRSCSLLRTKFRTSLLASSMMFPRLS